MAGATPTVIEKLGDREVRIAWDDGHVSVYRNPDLRFLCSCAACVDEWTRDRHLRRDQIPDDIVPIGMHLVGNYAVQLAWSDGHESGIYSYDYLREICPCAPCAARRDRR